MISENQKKDYIRSKRYKRRKFICIVGIPYLILAIFIFLFGYDAPLFDKIKLAEFLPAFLLCFFLIIFIAMKKYKIYSLCPHCGIEIKNIKKDTFVGKIEFLGTIDKTIYKTVNTTVKGKTVYPRGGYAMRNSTMEHTSESTYEINQKVPIIEKHYLYNIEHRCNHCKGAIYHTKEDSSIPLTTKEE